MSKLCLDAWYNGQDLEGCFPNTTIGTIASIWNLINGCVGFTGNLLTLLAIPYAGRKKKFNLHNNWSTTGFILNLAFSDMLYCACCMSINTILYMRKRWDWGLPLCRFYANIIYSNAYSAWMSVAMVAASRCVTIVNASKPTIFSSRKNRLAIYILIRIYGFVLLIPDNIGVSQFHLLVVSASPSVQN